MQPCPGRALRLTHAASVPVLGGIEAGGDVAGLPRGEVVLINPRQTPHYLPTEAGSPELSAGLKSAGDRHCQFSYNSCHLGALQAYSSVVVHLGPFFKMNKTNKEDTEKIPRVLYFLATPQNCVRKSTGKWGVGGSLFTLKVDIVLCTNATK